jgi:RNA polymerase sigma-70 factor (ECF subfamily)
MDSRAIEAMYRTHGRSVLRRARALMGNEDDARELLQEVFASLVGRPEQYAGKSSAATWLYSVTTHRCLNRLRNERVRRRILEAHGSTTTETSPESPETHAVLRRLLVSLPRELAEVAIYRYLDGMTHEEIAQVLGCSRRHVGDLVTRLHLLVDEEAS